MQKYLGSLKSELQFKSIKNINRILSIFGLDFTFEDRVSILREILLLRCCNRDGRSI